MYLYYTFFEKDRVSSYAYPCFLADSTVGKVCWLIFTDSLQVSFIWGSCHIRFVFKTCIPCI